MLLSPSDLGDPWHIAIVRLRTGQASDAAPHRPEVRTHRWAKQLNLSAEVAAVAQPSQASINAVRIGWIFLFVGLLMTKLAGSHSWLSMAFATIFIGGMYLFNTEYLPRQNFRRLHTGPVSSDEIKKLKGSSSRPMTRLLRKMAGEQELAPDEKDPLTRLYFELAQEVMNLSTAAPETEAEIRRTLRSLGESVARVPLPATTGRDEPADLIADAEMLAARAHREPDTVVAESLLRQADALLVRARALDKDVLRIRRTRVLRDELTAQIEAMRAALPHFTHSTVQANPEWEALAESVRGIAQEATALSDAREELAIALNEMIPQTASKTTPVTAATEPTKQIQRLGRG